MKGKITFALLMVGFSLAHLHARGPNILFCISDDQSYPHASAYGTTWVKTPAFDRVAREGLLFTRAYTPNAKCAPSRACILTGRNSWQLEAAANHNGFYPRGYRSFMEALADKGYFTGFTGKGWAPGVAGEVNGKPRQLTGPAFNALKTKPPTGAMAAVDYAANFDQFLQERPAGQPFIFWYGGHEPHRRYEPGSGVALGQKHLGDIDRVPKVWPDDPIVRHDLLDYAFEVEYFDRHLGKMLALLERAGELENTLVVVTSDNGMPFPHAKGASYELSHHLPLAIRWGAGIVRSGRRIESYVSFIDFAPTFVEVAGLTAETAGMERIQGRSLLPILRDQAERREAGSNYVLIGQERHDVGRPDDVGYPVRGVVQDDFIYLRNFEPGRWPMCDPITGYLNTDGSPTKTLILEQNRQGLNHWLWELNFGRRPAEELYDLHADPDCMFNLAGSPVHASRRATMARVLLSNLAAQKDPRTEGNGAIFDRYPDASAAKNFYERTVLKGEKVTASWVNPTDFEPPGFDPERPLAPESERRPANTDRPLSPPK